MVLNHVSNNNIWCIKYLRTRLGIGLKEAKDLHDAYRMLDDVNREALTRVEVEEVFTNIDANTYQGISQGFVGGARVPESLGALLRTKLSTYADEQRGPGFEHSVPSTGELARRVARGPDYNRYPEDAPGYVTDEENYDRRNYGDNA